MLILGIETSCDETAVAIVRDGVEILSNVVVSQIDIFAEYGGVIPEVAARSHLEVMLPVIDRALTDAGCDWDDIDAIAVTHAPGLLGSLLIGTLTARTLAILHDKPLYAVHHLKSHVYANWLKSDNVYVHSRAASGRPVATGGRRSSSPCQAPDSLKPTGAVSTRALIFDSYFDDYRGVVLYVRVVDGEILKNSEILMMAAGTKGLALEVGILTPKMSPRDKLSEGEIGYIVTNLKTTREAKVGDTVTLVKAPAENALPGYKNVLPFVYAGFFPVSNDQYKELKEAIEKLALSDSALRYEPENSPVLGFGLRIGFLGLLHMDIIKERLEREFNLDLIVTNPSTNYEVVMNNGEVREIKSAADLPDASEIKEIREPWVKGEIILPKSMIGNVLNLINEKRGHQTNVSYIEDRAVIDFEAPMANLLTDFYDQLKSATSGYASFNYELAGYRADDLVRVDFLVGGHKMDALSVMAHRSEADGIGREVTKKLKEVIPRQNWEVALQAAIGARVIARETIGAYRKDVTVKIHTGDRDRKAKLLEKQKRGKARMKRFGKIDIPSEAFTVMLKRD